MVGQGMPGYQYPQQGPRPGNPHMMMERQLSQPGGGPMPSQPMMSYRRPSPYPTNNPHHVMIERKQQPYAARPVGQHVGVRFAHDRAGAQDRSVCWVGIVNSIP